MTKHSTLFQVTLIYFSIIGLVLIGCSFALLMVPAQDKFRQELLIGVAKTVESPEVRAEIAKHEQALLLPRSKANESMHNDARNRLQAITAQSPAAARVSEIVAHLTNRFIVALAILAVAILLSMYIILRLILIPLDKLILGAQQVSQGNLKVDFRGMSGSHSEIAGLATVLQNLTVNFGELLFIMNNAVEQGRKNLELIRSGSADAENAIEDFEYLLQSMSDMVEYFRSRQ